MTDPKEARIRKLEERIEDMRGALEEANGHLAEALDHANTYVKADEVRPSAMRACSRAFRRLSGDGPE